MLVRSSRLISSRICVLRTLQTSSWSGKNSQDGQTSSTKLLLSGAVLGSAVVAGMVLNQKLKAEATNLPVIGERIEKLPMFSKEEVSKHDDVSKRVWVTYKNGVYDITDFISHHPGAKNIMMAAGGSIEPFWAIYAVHNQPSVFKLLEKFRIGNLKEQDVIDNRSLHDNNDPFGNEPIRHPGLNVVSPKPFNAETPLSVIGDSFFTPNDMFYVRNHLHTPNIQAKDYELEITGLGIKDKTLTLEDIKKFPKHSVTSVVQCGGNRRAEMKAKKDLKGLPWTGGAIGQAKWSGARLYDVLKAAGMSEDNIKVAHIQFEAYDEGADGSPYGASIPVEKGFNPYGDVILAYEMNDETLPRDHGYPVRVVVPGVVGARSVKWLNRIILSEAESGSHWQQNDYKGFNPGVDWKTIDYSKSPSIQNMPVTSLICEPENGSTVKANQDGTIKIKGYAYSGGGNRIVRIDLTTDGGKTWFEGQIDKQDSAKEPRHYGWTFWSATVKVPKGQKDLEVWCKAVDSNYNVQPESFENIWNVRGLLSSAYSRLRVKIQ